MPSLVIKKLPDEIRSKLKRQAQHNHQSMVKEAIALLEEALDVSRRTREVPGNCSRQ
jgi:plasmid stability protein